VAIEVSMPQMGADMTEGTVVRWIKQVGDEVERGEIIAEIETDKATVELEAFEAGVMRKHVVDEGETVPVGQVIALMGTADEAIAEGGPERKPRPAVADRKVEQPQSGGQAAAADQGPPGAAPAIAEAVEKGEEQPAETEALGAPARTAARKDEDGVSPDGRARVSPVARRIAEEAGIDPTRLSGSGPDGRVLRRDVEAAIQGKAPAAALPRDEKAAAAQPAARAAATPPSGEGQQFEVQPLTRMRTAIARRMSQSKQQAPHYYLTLDVDMTAAMAFREQFNAAAGEETRASINDLVIKACAIALGRHPRFNAEFTEAGVKVYAKLNIANGVALDDGLIAPALLDVGSKTLGRIAREARDLANRARGGNLRAEEYSAATFTITNLGAFGVETLIGIINPPQAAILGVGSVMPAAVVRDGQIAVRQVMKVALSADHRVTDGAEGARFIKEIQGLLENPAALAL
jgi:pyruvate dehydrogenase E2 component (dihydrolipoamide acetyltransferase)